MTLDEVIVFYGTLAEAAKKLGVSKKVLYMYKYRGYIPEHMQLKIAKLSKGCLSPNFNKKMKHGCPIKYRIYDFDHNEFRPVRQMGFTKNLLRVNYLFQTERITKSFTEFPGELQRALNLFDVDGEELYEGDIIDCIDLNCNQTILTESDFWILPDAFDSEIKFKIIGNIINYEQGIS